MPCLWMNGLFRFQVFATSLSWCPRTSRRIPIWRSIWYLVCRATSIESTSMCWKSTWSSWNLIWNTCSLKESRLAPTTMFGMACLSASRETWNFYSTLGKKKELHMYAWCLAGPKHCPCEEIDHDPKWVSTMFAERPWNDEPSLAQIPMDASRPEYAFKFDMFHLMKVGMSRDIVGSLIVVLARLGFFDFSARESRDLPERLERAHGHFRLFCAEQK